MIRTHKQLGFSADAFSFGDHFNGERGGFVKKSVNAIDSQQRRTSSGRTLLNPMTFDLFNQGRSI